MRVRAEVRVLAGQAVGAGLVQVKQLVPLWRHVVAHLGQIAKDLHRLVDHDFMHLTAGELAKIDRVALGKHGSSHVGGRSITRQPFSWRNVGDRWIGGGAHA